MAKCMKSVRKSSNLAGDVYTNGQVGIKIAAVIYIDGGLGR